MTLWNLLHSAWKEPGKSIGTGYFSPPQKSNIRPYSNFCWRSSSVAQDSSDLNGLGISAFWCTSCINVPRPFYWLAVEHSRDNPCSFYWAMSMPVCSTLSVAWPSPCIEGWLPPVSYRIPQTIIWRAPSLLFGQQLCTVQPICSLQSRISPGPKSIESQQLKTPHFLRHWLVSDF